MNCCSTETIESISAEEKEEQSELRLKFILSLVCVVTLFVGWAGSKWLLFPAWVEHFFLITAFLSGGYFPTLGVLEDLKTWKFNVNFLMVIAALGAALIGAEEEGAVLMFLFSFSGALEEYASGRTRKAIRSLMKLSPTEATVLREGKESIIPVAELQIGDTLIVHPGERIAGDGVITEGITSIDESSLTGESIPVDRSVGARVMAGSINRFGLIKVQMDHAVNDTTLAKIFKIVEEAQHEKAPTQRLVDQYGGPYTWVIITATILTFLVCFLGKHMSWNESLYRAMTLMVVASPCALVLSIPSAVLAAIAAGAWNGILFKGGRAVEVIGQIRAVAFDKTGTLTQGKPHLSQARYAEGVDPKSVLAMVASVEQNSEHPLAQVIVKEARTQNLNFERASESRAVPGMGMEGTVNTKLIRVGNEGFVCVHGAMEPWVRETLVDYRSKGLTCLVAAHQKPLVVFGVSDTIRNGATQAISKLNAQGIHTIMLTGDHQASASVIANQLGLTEYQSSLLPHQKVKAVKELSVRHGQVAMVGDGVNDAPALVSATVGIAMGGTGSDVAMENADIVLVSDAIERIPEIVDLGRRTQRIIRQNLFFAIGVMLALIVTTCLGKLKLALGVIGHEGSTVLVVFNSLRLLFFRKKTIS